MRIIFALVLLLMPFAAEAITPPIIWGNPAAKLLTKDLKFGTSDTTTTCNAAAAGNIRYNAGTFQGCDGSAWYSMNAGAVVSGTTYTANQYGVALSSATNATLTILAPDASTAKFLKSGGASANPAWSAVTLTSDVTGVLPVANGGTGATALTQGSVVFAGASGVYTQDNANFFYDVSTHRLGLGTTAPASTLHLNATGLNVLRIGTSASTHIDISENQFSAYLGGAGSTFYFQESSSGNMVMVAGGGGKVGIGEYTPTAQLHTTGSVRFAAFGSGAATFDASGNISSVSDERLKTLIVPFTEGLDVIMNISPIRYHWNVISGMETMHEYVGFSAQNVQAALPEGAGQNAKGYLSIQDRAISAALVNAIKELEARIVALEKNKK